MNSSTQLERNGQYNHINIIIEWDHEIVSRIMWVLSCEK